MMENHDYIIDLSVRDYEVDMQGIVNNSVYMNYFEHARHEFLNSIGLNFKEFAEKGINLVVVRAELDYKGSLASGDEFSVQLKCERESALKIVFYEEIIRKSDGRLIAKGKYIGTALNEKGRPFRSPELEELLPAKT